MNEGGHMKKQKGLTMISWMVVIAIVVFNGVIGMNVIPVYINDHSVKSIMKNLEMDTAVRGKSPKQLKEIISKRLRINNVYSIEKENIVIKKIKNGHYITINYEPRGKLVGNLDYIVSFRHEARIPAT